jgi:tetratricopeptide (TPR) repeat protein
MARGAEFLLRHGQRDAALFAARDAQERSRAFAAADIVALHAAAAFKDTDWALQCIRRAMSISPAPSHALARKVVELKYAGGALDATAETVDVLKVLSRAEPENSLWPQMLAHIRFQRGAWERAEAIYQALNAMNGGAADPSTYAVATAARYEFGDFDGAVELLRKGLQEHPSDLALRNNLVYILASDPGRIHEALTQIPDLLKDAKGNPHVSDTAAYVYLRDKDYEKAEEILRALYPSLKEGEALWFRARTYLAEIAIARGQFVEAALILREIMPYSSGLSDRDVVYASRLLTAAERGVAPKISP